MASASTASATTTASLSPATTTPVVILPLRSPQTANIDLVRAFGRLVDEPTQKELQRLTKGREDLAAALLTSTPEGALRAVETYLPAFVGLANAYNGLSYEEKAEFLRPWRPGWGTPFNPTWATRQYTMGSFQWEIIMIYATWAIAQRRIAAEKSTLLLTDDSQTDTLAPEAAKALCTAAGIFEAITRDLIPQWDGREKRDDVKNVPECNPEAWNAMANLCLAEAQQLTIRKALRGGTSLRVVTKLAVDVAHKFESAAAAFKNLPVPAGEVEPQIVSWLAVAAAVWLAVAYRLVAVEQHQAVEYGKAIAYLRLARKKLNVNHPTSYTDPEGAKLLAAFAAEKTTQDALLAEWEHDNSTLYYAMVPAETDLLPLPEARCLSKVLPLTLPASVDFVLGKASTSRCLVC